MINGEQELRLQLALRCFEVLGDAEKAVQAAARLERYVRSGGPGAAKARNSTGGSGDEAPVSAPPEPSHAQAATPEERGVRRQGSGPKRRWNPEDERILGEMWNNGEATADIARVLARTPASVRERARALKLTRRKAGRRLSGSPPSRPPAEVEAVPEAAAPASPQAVQPVQASEPAPAQAERVSPRHDAAATDRPVRRKVRGRGTSGLAAAGGGGARRRAAGGIGEVSDLRVHEVRRPETTLETVINFVRSRDYSVVWTPYGELMVDARRNMAQDEFIDWANELRRRLGKSEFPCDLQRAG